MHRTTQAQTTRKSYKRDAAIQIGLWVLEAIGIWNLVGAVVLFVAIFGMAQAAFAALDRVMPPVVVARG